jgi:hypothetical protein
VITEIEYRYSGAPFESVSLLGDLLSTAIRSSTQWQWERQLATVRTTDCVNVLAPKNRSQDISITLLVGYKQGMQMVDALQLEPM